MDIEVANALTLREARPDDDAATAAIWNHEVRATLATTDTAVRDVDRRWRGRGVGRLLVAHLLERATALGHHSVLARITTDNSASRRLHELLGFQLIGIEEEVAFKLGRWVDVAVYQRRVYTSLGRPVRSV